MALASSPVAAAGVRATCAICFREFLTDDRGRLFRHVRWLGKPERCPGFKFPPAGVSLRGTEWALDRCASLLLALDTRYEELSARPILNGLGPFSPLYEGVWYQAVMAIEHQRQNLVPAIRAEMEELAVRLEEWQPTTPYLGPTPIHRVALWKCRAGTAVPLCYSAARRRPAGDPIMVPTSDGVDCSPCLVLMEQFSNLTAESPV